MRDIGGADKGQIYGRFSCIVAIGERVEWMLVVGAIAWLHFQQQKRVGDNDADHLSVMYTFNRIFSEWPHCEKYATLERKRLPHRRSPSVLHAHTIDEAGQLETVFLAF